MIRRRIAEEAKQTALEELYQHSTIESPYIDEVVFGQPATSPPKSQPADAFSE